MSVKASKTIDMDANARQPQPAEPEGSSAARADNEDGHAKHARGRGLQTRFRWLLTGLLLLGTVAVIASLIDRLAWGSDSLGVHIRLDSGCIILLQRPPGWRPTTSQGVPWFQGDPGDVEPEAIIAPPSWRFGSSALLRTWRIRWIPLWPFLLVNTLLVVLLWCTDRRTVQAEFRALRSRLIPETPQPLRAKAVIVFGCLHLGVVAGLLAILGRRDDTSGAPSNDVLTAAESILVLFGWSTLAWALVWAWLFTRLRNALARPRAPQCAECGYNLTGNVSGRCPECGHQCA